MLTKENLRSFVPIIVQLSNKLSFNSILIFAPILIHDKSEYVLFFSYYACEVLLFSVSPFNAVEINYKDEIRKSSLEFRPYLLGLSILIGLFVILIISLFQVYNFSISGFCLILGTALVRSYFRFSQHSYLMNNNFKNYLSYSWVLLMLIPVTIITLLNTTNSNDIYIVRMLTFFLCGVIAGILTGHHKIIINSKNYINFLNSLKKYRSLFLTSYVKVIFGWISGYGLTLLFFPRLDSDNQYILSIFLSVWGLFLLIFTGLNQNFVRILINSDAIENKQALKKFLFRVYKFYFGIFFIFGVINLILWYADELELIHYIPEFSSSILFHINLALLFSTGGFLIQPYLIAKSKHKFNFIHFVIGTIVGTVISTLVVDSYLAGPLFCFVLLVAIKNLYYNFTVISKLTAT